MNPLRIFELFLLKVFGLAAVLAYFVPKYLPSTAPKFVLERTWTAAVLASFLMIFSYEWIFYPRFLSPLRFIPQTTSAERGQLIFESPRGYSALQWMKQQPNAQLLRIKTVSGIGGILVSGPDACRDILNTHTYDFEKPWGLRAFLARAIGWGLILVEGAEHKRQRKSLTPAFHIRRIRELYGLMWEKTQILLTALDEDITKHKKSDSDGWAIIEVGEWASRITLDIIGPVAMGRDFESLTHEKNEIAEAFLELLRPSPDRLIFLLLHFVIPEYIVKRLPLANNRTLDRIGALLTATCAEIVTEKRKIMEDPNAKLSDFDILSRIMQTGEFTDKEIINQMLTFLAAGHETTASALTWVCYLCAKHPEVQEKLRAEIHEKIASHDAPITWDLLEGMPYLNGVCEETQRLYPTVPTTVREAIRETEVAGYTIPKGTDFILVPYAINRHPNYWGDNADMIVPERWIDNLPDGTQRPNKNGGTSTNFAELTFLHGPRSCIGRDFAKAELRCAVAGVIGKFQIELHTHEEPKVSGVITMKPDGGMYLRMKTIPGW